MKRCIVIADGSADRPIEKLGGRTPLAAADTPNMDRVAREGVVGTVRTIPEGFTAGSDVAMMSILGYAPEEFYTGRAPLEAANMGIRLADGDYAARCNLVTIEDGRMADYSAGHISPEEAALVIKSLNEETGREGVKFYAGKGYRNLLVLSGLGDFEVETTPPHDIARREVKDYLPSGRDAGVFLELMERGRGVVGGHEVNRRRRREGKREATDIWLWGEGGATKLVPFEEAYGLRGAVITAVDLVGGICALSGWERIVVPGATGYYDTDYAGKAAAAIEVLERFELVLVHVEAPDEASHNGDVANKVAAIEDIDRLVVGPLMASAGAREGFRLLVMSDHYTLLSSGAHDGTPVPFAVWGEGVEASGAFAFDEGAASGGLQLVSGPELMALFAGKTGEWDL